jgi:MOSC domain-containing protein YiiM
VSRVVAVSRSPRHRFSKAPEAFIRIVAGHGVEGDAHAGTTVKHRSRWRKDPAQPNLRQVHLIHEELLHELRAGGFDLLPGALGENVTTAGVDLLALPAGTRLRLGASAVIEVTGLRNPCVQMDRYRAGLMQAVLDRDTEGRLVRKAGVMALAVMSGEVFPGDPIAVDLPEPPFRALQVV